MFGLLTLWALWNWHSPYTAAQGSALNFQVPHDAQGSWQASAALQQLRQAAPAPVPKQDTDLQESPFWLLLQPLPASQPIRIEFPSRHAYT